MGFGEAKAAVSMPTQLVISYLRFSVATHDRQRKIRKQSWKNHSLCRGGNAVGTV